MAWIYLCVLYISLFQMSVRSYGIIQGPSAQRSERSANQKSNVPVPDGSVVFPGLTSRSGEDLSLHIPEECKRVGICEFAPHDKDDLIERIIKDYQKRNKTFNSDVLEAPQIAERIGPDEENVELCASTERLYVPKLAQDANKQWHRVVNTDSNPQQRFRVEICTGKADAPCSPIAIFQDGYQARCVQKYVLRHIVAINPKDEVVEKPFMVPSCCSCVARTV